MKTIISICLCSLLLSGCSPKNKEVITLAIPSSLEAPFEQDIIPQIEETYPNIDIVAIYDGSGKLQIQIEEGLAASIFMSASSKQMNALIDQGYIDEASLTYILENQLVLIKHKGSQTKVTGFDTIDQAKMIALGDSEIVPAGEYAKMALTKLKLWDEISDKVSEATNVSEVLSWVASGNCEVGIVYASDVKRNNQVEIIATCKQEWLEKPILYPIAMLNNLENKRLVQKVFDYICSQEALDVFGKWGFESYETDKNN